MLACRGVTVRFGGLVPVNALDFELPERGVFMLVGPNGAGKTTFINALSGLCPTAAGSIRMNGVELCGLASYRMVAHGIGRSFQKAELFGGMTALDNVLVGLHALTRTGLDGAFALPSARREERAARERALQALDELGLADVARTAASVLPYGYQKLLDVARALVSEPRLLLLDEPFAGVTEGEVPALLGCIERAGRVRTVLMIEHHLELVMDLAERVTVLNFGHKIAEGPPAAIRRDPAVIRSYLGTRAAAS
jgi:ABC-type branched-subunit amino acid transport system ATPase component